MLILMSESSHESYPQVSEEEQAPQRRRSQRLLDRATAAKCPSTSSIENIPSARPRKSVRSPSRTETLPSGLVRSQVQRIPVPQSKQSESYHSGEERSYHSGEERSYPSSKERSYPSSEVSKQSKRYPAEVIKNESERYKVEESESDSSEENQSEQFQFEPSTSTAEFSASEVPTQQYEKFEAAPEEELSEPSASRPVSSYIPLDCQAEKFYQHPEEEKLYKWSRLSPIPESNPCL